jgi:hypothetical protein
MAMRIINLRSSMADISAPLPGFGVDQLHVDPHPASAALRTAFARGAHVEVAPDLLQIRAYRRGGNQ